jgi:hypothetical protein
MVQSIYDSESDITIGSQETPVPSQDEKKLMDQNTDSMVNFLSDIDAKETARLEAAAQSVDNVNNEFLNGLGC